MPNFELKVFELRFTDQGEKEWVCARSVIDAIITYVSTTNISLYELSWNDEIVEIPREKWGDYKIRNNERGEDYEDGQEKTFEEYMKDQEHSDIIAGTMY